MSFRQNSPQYGGQGQPPQQQHAPTAAPPRQAPARGAAPPQRQLAPQQQQNYDEMDPAHYQQPQGGPQQYEQQQPPAQQGGYGRGRGAAAAPQQQQPPQQRQAPPQQPQARGGYQPAARQGRAQQQAQGRGGRGTFSGTRAGRAKHPIPTEGGFIFQVLDSKETEGTPGEPWFNAELLVIWSDNPNHPEGTKCTMLACLYGRGRSIGAGKMKQLAMATDGQVDEAAFDEALWGEFEQEALAFDSSGQTAPSDLLLAAMAGKSEGVEIFGDNPLRGRAARCRITPPSAPDEQGRMFSEWYWEPLYQSDFVPELAAGA